MRDSNNGSNNIVVTSDYLNRHKVSIRLLNKFQIMVQGMYSEYGITWSKMAEIAERVAMHWNTQDGQLNNFNHFALACRKRAFDAVFGKKDTERIVNNVKTSSNKALEKTAFHRVIGSANVYENYEAPEKLDYYPNSFNIGSVEDDEPNGAA